ncbi:MAG TPA: (d)CMP kinase [Thiotrichales bacterium]|nr:(d)CMP kinase [Thiotrichales bacterium]
MADAPVLTIDGPSGSGKGTVARRVAETLGWRLLDSGALYRILGLAAERAGVSLEDEKGLAELARGLEIGFESRPGEEGVRVLLGGEDVSREIRTESAGDRASRVARWPAVREALLERQRDFAGPPGLVADGRDMGTVVFPGACCKVYLTASAEERARRRHKQLKEKGLNVSIQTLCREIAERDRRDAERSVAPLRPAPDAVVIDSTGVTIDQVVDRVLAVVRERLS